MCRGGAIGGCWADFSPKLVPTRFLKPRPLSSRSTLCLSPHLSSSSLSHVAGLTAAPLHTTAVSPPLLSLCEWLVNTACKWRWCTLCYQPSRHCLNPYHLSSTIDYNPSSSWVLVMTLNSLAGSGQRAAVAGKPRAIKDP